MELVNAYLVTRHFERSLLLDAMQKSTTGLASTGAMTARVVSQNAGILLAIAKSTMESKVVKDISARLRDANSLYTASDAEAEDSTTLSDISRGATVTRWHEYYGLTFKR